MKFRKARLWNFYLLPRTFHQIANRYFVFCSFVTIFALWTILASAWGNISGYHANVMINQYILMPLFFCGFGYILFQRELKLDALPLWPVPVLALVLFVLSFVTYAFNMIIPTVAISLPREVLLYKEGPIRSYLVFYCLYLSIILNSVYYLYLVFRKNGKTENRHSFVGWYVVASIVGCISILSIMAYHFSVLQSNQPFRISDDLGKNFDLVRYISYTMDPTLVFLCSMGVFVFIVSSSIKSGAGNYLLNQVFLVLIGGGMILRLFGPVLLSFFDFAS